MIKPTNSAFVSYTLRLNSTQAVSEQVIEQLSQLHGVIAVKSRSGRIILSYNVTLTNLKSLLHQADNIGLQTRQNYWQKIRTGWHCFTEQNLQDHLKHQHQCCGKPPKIR